MKFDPNEYIPVSEKPRSSIIIRMMFGYGDGVTGAVEGAGDGEVVGADDVVGALVGRRVGVEVVGLPIVCSQKKMRAIQRMYGQPSRLSHKIHERKRVRMTMVHNTTGIVIIAAKSEISRRPSEQHMDD